MCQSILRQALAPYRWWVPRNQAYSNAEDGSPLLWRRRLGHALRVLRVDAGLTGDQAGTAVERSASWISRLETGRIGLRTRDLRELLDLYGLTDGQRRRELETLATRGQERSWWGRFGDLLPDSYARFIGFEDAAVAFCTYENAVFPGLLQTSSYSRAIFRQTVPLVKPDFDRLVDVRNERQKILTREDPPMLDIVVDESVLHRPIGGSTIFHEQLLHVLQLMALPNLTIRVLPFTQSENIVLVTAFTLMSFDGDPEVVYVETATGGVFEGDEEAQLYRQIFQQLKSLTLDAEASVAALRQAQERNR
jgi:transcriptional regulator with XRE-family HTH domain